MKLKLTFLSAATLFGLIALNTDIYCNVIQKENDDKLPMGKVEPVTASILVAALVPVVTNLISGFFGSLMKPTDYQDTIIYGRSMRIKMCGSTCVQIVDRATGITAVGNAETAQEAIGEATKKMFDELLTRNLLSLHDLCELHIIFPHPVQGCPVINPCNLITWVATTDKPCVNKLGDSYCNSMQNHCDTHYYETYMHENCWKTCTKGTCSLTPVGPIDPCTGKPTGY